MSSVPTCNFLECTKPPNGVSLCKAHQQQLRRSGELRPIGIRPGTIPTADRFWSKVEKTDDCWQWTGPMRPQGYGVFAVDRKHKYAHRVAWELDSGIAIPDGMVIDHICFNRRCVRPSHLRATTMQLNAEYQHRGKRKVPVSGTRGVYRNRNKWLARVKHKGVVHNVGTFDIKEDAMRAVADKRHALFQFPEYQEASK